MIFQIRFFLCTLVGLFFLRHIYLYIILKCLFIALLSPKNTREKYFVLQVQRHAYKLAPVRISILYQLLNVERNVDIFLKYIPDTRQNLTVLLF